MSPHPHLSPQARSEFGRTWTAPRGEAAATAAPAPAAAGSSGSGAATGQAVASFYGSLVQTSGRGWVSGGTLQDGEPSAPAVVPAAGSAGAGAGAAEPLHAGLGSAAARAEQAAEAAALSYPAPAGPAPRGEQGAAIQPPAATWAAQQGQQEQQQEPGRRAPQEGVRYGIARSNVGFQLLKKAGWTEGAGLGANEQGMAEPLAAFQQKGNLGLGYAHKPPPGGSKRAAAGAAGTAAAGAAGAQPAAPRRPLPEDPLDKEDTETKVKRVKQVGAGRWAGRGARDADGVMLRCGRGGRSGGRGHAVGQGEARCMAAGAGMHAGPPDVQCPARRLMAATLTAALACLPAPMPHSGHASRGG